MSAHSSCSNILIVISDLTIGYAQNHLAEEQDFCKSIIFVFDGVEFCCCRKKCKVHKYGHADCKSSRITLISKAIATVEKLRVLN